MSDLPDPLTPPDCDLRDFPFMPLDCLRLRRSKAWLMAKRTPDLAFYMMNLWTASWHEKPTASLEDDDDVLADLAMCEPRKWSKVKSDVLRGWVKCSDGRLYHPVVAEKAIEGWKAKQAQRQRTEAARAAKEQKRLQAMSSSPQSSVTTPVTEPVTQSVTEAVTASKGEGEGQGQREGQGYLKPSVPDGTGADAPPNGLSPNEALFQVAVPWLVANGGKEGNVRSLLGGAIKHIGAESAWQLASQCMREKPMEPIAWLAGGLNDRIKARSASGDSKLGKAGQATAAAAQRFLEESNADE